VISPKAATGSWRLLFARVKLKPDLWQTAQEAVIQITPLLRDLAENSYRVLKTNFNLEMHHG